MNWLMEIIFLFSGILLLFFGFGREAMPGLMIMVAGLCLMLTALYLYNRRKR
jgi:hypothetical protein